MTDVIVALPQGIRASGLVAELQALNWKVHAASPTRNALIQLVRQRAARILILDEHYLGGETKSLIRALRDCNSHLKILLWCEKLRSAMQYQLNKADVDGYFLHEAEIDEIHKGCRIAKLGHQYIPLDVNRAVRRFRKYGAEHPVISRLSKRESQIFQMISTGVSVGRIAADLFISRKTVNTFRYRLHKKLNVRCDVQLAHIAIKYGLIEAKVDGGDGELLA